MESAVNNEEAPSYYRGAIRHIQSDEEMSFNTWEDAVKFIGRFVPIEIRSNQDSTKGS